MIVQRASQEESVFPCSQQNFLCVPLLPKISFSISVFPVPTNGNRKATVSFVGLFLLPVLDWKTLVLMCGDLPLQMRWCRNVSKEQKSTSVCRSRLTNVCDALMMFFFWVLYQCVLTWHCWLNSPGLGNR